MYLYWSEELHRRTHEPAAEDKREVTKHTSKDAAFMRWGTWMPPRINTAEAIEEAAQLMDRWHRLFMRTLRQMRDLRRYQPPVIVNNGGQVNLAQQQVNMAGAPQMPEGDL